MQNLTKDQIVRAITSADNTQQAIDNLYRQVLRMYDRVNYMVGYPVISQTTADYIYRAGSGKFGNNFLVGWIDRGMPVGEVPDWQADISGCKVQWSEAAKNPSDCVRVRFADHLDNRMITPGESPD